MRVQGRFQQPGSDINIGNDPVIGHARRADDAQYTNMILIQVLGRGHDAAIIEYLVTGFAANKHLHTVRLNAFIQHVEHETLL